jgi:hypothetical protein
LSLATAFYAGLMNRIMRLWATVVAGLFTVLALPSIAWAADSEELRRGRGSLTSACGAFCCLFVVASIVVAVVLITRSRNRRQQ